MRDNAEVNNFDVGKSEKDGSNLLVLPSFFLTDLNDRTKMETSKTPITQIELQTIFGSPKTVLIHCIGYLLQLNPTQFSCIKITTPHSARKLSSHLLRLSSTNTSTINASKTAWTYMTELEMCLDTQMKQNHFITVPKDFETVVKTLPISNWDFWLTTSSIHVLIGTSGVRKRVTIAVLSVNDEILSQLFLEDLNFFFELLEQNNDMNFDELLFKVPSLRMVEIGNVLGKHLLVKNYTIHPTTFGDIGRMIIKLEIPSLKWTPEFDQRTTEEEVIYWRDVYDLHYLELETTDNPYVTWMSSFTGEPIPTSEMEEWVKSIVREICAFGPQVVLEIGCGTGNLLRKIATSETVLEYHGTDFSYETVAYIEKLLQKTSFGIGSNGLERKIKVTHREAPEFEESEIGKYDTIIINSVVQYFPNVKYLTEVLETAIKLGKPGGRVFVGDVRNLDSQEEFHAAVLLESPNSVLSKEYIQLGDLLEKVADRVDQDFELLLHPNYFTDLAKLNRDKVSHVVISMHRGRSWNEMARFRYNVVIHLQNSVRTIVDHVPTVCYGWKKVATGSVQRVNSLVDIGDILRAKNHQLFIVLDVPNKRIARAEFLASLYRSTESSHSTFLTQADKLAIKYETNSMDPEEFAQLGETYGYNSRIQFSRKRGCFDILYFIIDVTGVRSYIDETEEDDLAFHLTKQVNTPRMAKEKRKVFGILRMAIKAAFKTYKYEGPVPRLVLK